LLGYGYIIPDVVLSGEPSAERYRVSVKREAHGATGAYIDEKLQVGDVVDASAAWGAFTLRPGDAPVVLLSAGIGATPVLAMLHALAAEASPREVWWIHGARDRREHRASPRRPPHLPAGPPGAGPLVSFARSGLNVRWGPAFQSLLELAEACDVPVRWSCRTGVCHTCETGLVVGTVGYRPDPVDAPADGNVLICCSQPDGDIVIDL
jgi:ferredoxin